MNYVISSLKSIVAIAGIGMAFHAVNPPVALANIVQDAYERTIKPNTSRRPSSSTPTFTKPEGIQVTPEGAATSAKPTPAKQGRYVTSRGAASRSCGSEKTLLALVPSEQLNDLKAIIPKLSTGGFTIQAHPSFWFQVPFGAAELKELEFILQDEQDEDLYRTPLEVSPESDLVQVALPAGTPGLELDQRYRWTLKFRLGCGLDNPSAPLQFVKGWIQRYEPEAPLLSQLAQATPLQQAQLYADAGVWFDALNILAPLQSAEPQDGSSHNAWQDLLKLYAIELQSSEL